MPGLIQDTLEHFELTQAAVAKATNISPGVICDILKNRKSVSTDVALRLEKCLGISAEFVLRTQSYYQYCVAYHEKASRIETEVQSLCR